MNLHELSPAPGSNTKAYRKGRGAGSGNGKTAGRGHKGQWARSGGGVRVGFEGAVVDAQALLEKGILSKCQYGVKILGNGEISKKLIVKASAFSASAKEKIVAAGGKWEVV